MASWNGQGLGIQAMTLLLDGPGEGPPSVNGAQTWKNNFGLTSIYVVADPSFSMVPGSSVGTPQLTIIDPRTMQVVLVQEGYGGSYPPQLEQTALGNE
ncbi:MAG TPA: hypothetical protein ENK57_03960 [Polyangiaceae bacterium]|nr:hypothetical protein [Polyangiaceae bacterium]